jgi:hypothetical protein
VHIIIIIIMDKCPHLWWSFLISQIPHLTML